MFYQLIMGRKTVRISFNNEGVDHTEDFGVFLKWCCADEEHSCSRDLACHVSTSLRPGVYLKGVNRREINTDCPA
jgi:hypothetical protein